MNHDLVTKNTHSGGAAMLYLERMPDNCFQCRFFINVQDPQGIEDCECACFMTARDIEAYRNSRPDFCPLRPIIEGN